MRAGKVVQGNAAPQPAQNRGGLDRPTGSNPGTGTAPRQLLAASEATVHRRSTAAVAMVQATLRAGSQQVGDDVAVAANLHDIRQAVVQCVHDNLPPLSDSLRARTFSGDSVSPRVATHG